MPDRMSDAAASEPENPTPPSDAPTEMPDAAAPPTATEDGSQDPASTAPETQMPEYKGEPLDAGRGPGLGCFWIQIALLTFFLIFTPLTVTWGWDPLISGVLLIFTLILLLFSGQTIIFLLRLVAADRRTRRAPLNPSAKPTVGQMEDAAPAAGEPTAAPENPDEVEPADDEQPREEKPTHG